MNADLPKPAGTAAGRPVYDARIERIVNHNGDTRSLFLRLPEGARLAFIPGHFISVSIPLDGGTRVRPYTIASSPDSSELLEICFNLVPNGLASHYLFGLGAGDRLRFTGPFGTFTLDEAPESEAIFIAVSTAVAPARPMIRRALAKAVTHPPIRLIHAAPSAGELLYRHEFEELARISERFAFEPMIIGPVEDWNRAPSQLRELIEGRYIAGDRNRARRFFVSGIGKGVIELRDLLRAAGYERRAVQYERW